MEHVIRLWNLLPQEVVETKILARFRKGLDIYMAIKNMQCYNNEC